MYGGNLTRPQKLPSKYKWLASWSLACRKSVIGSCLFHKGIVEREFIHFSEISSPISILKDSSKIQVLRSLTRQRPYHVERTSSRPITEVKQHWARIVLGWETAWELRVPLAFLLLFFIFLFVFYFNFFFPLYCTSISCSFSSFFLNSLRVEVFIISL